MARKDNISFYNSRVEQERQELIAMKKAGNYNLFSHLDKHPIAGLVKKGARLPDSHPLMQLKSRQSA